jgi:membrane associated rhomboid family serine protease
VDELTLFILIGVSYIVVQDKVAILKHLGKFGDTYKKVWRWIRKRLSSIVRDEEDVDEAWATHTLIFLNVAAFIMSLMIGFWDTVLVNGFIPALAGQLWRWITHMFLHANIPVEFSPFSAHLLYNLIFLYIFGDNVEQFIGNIRAYKGGRLSNLNMYAIIYLIGGIVAVATQSTIMGWDSKIILIGASGAVSAVLGIYAVLFLSNRVYFGGNKRGILAVTFLGIWFAMQVLAAVLVRGSGVAFWAHIGGFVYGVGVGFVLKRVGKGIEQEVEEAD